MINDGLGGHDRGEVASKLVGEVLADCFENHYKSVDFFKDAYMKAESQLEEIQQQYGMNGSMKTTSAMLVIDGNEAQWCHIGDSRLYCFKNGNLSQYTRDHSVCQMLYAVGEIQEKDIRFHEDRNRLLKVMGNEWNGFEPEISKRIRISPGYDFLLCTDGFWEWIEEKQMQVLLRETKSAKEWVLRMCDHIQCNATGKDMDNYSAIAVRILKGD